MVVRTIVGFVLVGFLVLVLFVLPVWVMPVAVAAISVLAMHEMLYTTHFIKEKFLIAVTMAVAAILPFWVYWGSDARIGAAIIFVFIVMLFINALADHAHITFEKLAMAFLSALAVPLLLSSLLRIYMLENGQSLILVPFIVAFSTDIFAYFIGVTMGKRKLAPEISPKKTIEGMYGGLAGAVLSMVFFGLVMHTFFAYHVNYLTLLLMAVVGSFAALLGDLSMSYIKREAKIKDFGTILPGHGGVLDRFDSLLFAAPVIELLIYILPGIIQ